MPPSYKEALERLHDYIKLELIKPKEAYLTYFDCYPADGPVILSASYEEALEQLRNLMKEGLIKPNKAFVHYTDEWIHEEENIQNYQSYFDAWVRTEGDIRKVRQNELFCLQRLFGEDENEEEIKENYDRNRREGDTIVYWLLDFNRYIDNVRQ